ncbi:MAG TPA: hypothetical protein P5181_10925 [Dermatophilaceae bacterium]|nr:hypothetical protein [Dermatophilaceae bacterium]
MSASGPQDSLPIDVPLLPGEQVLWTGVPDASRILEPSDAAMIPFSVLWGGFAIFWEVMAIRMGAPWFALLWGVPFVLIGLHMMVGRFFVRRWQRARTRYVLTDRRALLLRGGSMRAEPTADGPREVLSSGAGRYLTVTFGQETGSVQIGRWKVRSDDAPRGLVFESVRDVDGLRAALSRIGRAAGPQDRR